MIKNILRQNREHKPQCLTFSVHERYQSGFANCNCDFFMLNFKGMKPWNTKFAEIPANHHLLEESIGVQEQAVNRCYDFILSQNKFGNYQMAKRLQPFMQVPIIQLEHTLPPRKIWSDSQIEACTKMVGDYNVFISEYSMKEWGFDYNENTEVIHHCVDTDVFQDFHLDRKKQILTVANDYINRDVFLNFTQYKKVTQGLPTRAVGDTKGFSVAANSIQELVNEYNESQVFLNTAHVSPIPTVMLEAAACGCAIVSCKTCAIPEYFTHGESILFAENDDEMRAYLEFLLKNEGEAKRLGENARKRMIEYCSVSDFVNKWDVVFEKVSQIPYRN